MTPRGWYVVLTAGSGPYEMPPRGPWSSEEAAREALGRWEERVGAEAGTIMAAHSARIAGPFRTRAAARAADIGDS